ncbi:MAG: bifunctional D-glycero-beta-D-manno-heptose-7-phosphate kinase/D-glycero-beta-D-manno-heptose 1-phosphate adenylyltransferase HldE [Methylococcales bacterium]|nr:bifunctional D-glycero-beta-D-manno-heptose-7-phosphate kinase/D-glycero-beta-D-manno-heptose 1-phosphate adenylyltransferase HldE [Methylococcales bacterium]
MKLPDYSSAHVLVVGDLMLDRYWHGTSTRISPEAPVPVVQVNNEEHRAGGAGNVALNIAQLGAKVALLGLVGNDTAANTLQNLLQSVGVNCVFQTIKNAPTITKLRITSHHQQLIRVDFEAKFKNFNESALLESYQQQLAHAQVVVLSDYGKGTLRNIEKMIQLARKMNKPVLIDPKGVDFYRYQYATLLTPNLTEFEAIVGHCQDSDDIVKKGMPLLKKLHLEALLITRGEQGMTLLTQQSPPLHLPTQAQEVFDVTGAGDSVISLLAASLAAQTTLETATTLANIAAGCVIGKLGTATVSIEELEEALVAKRAHHQGVGTLTEILNEIQHAQKKGEKIVLTNGCFDILHLGHITYLKQAKALGQRLVILVNTDESVKKLKGETRPINNLNQRMEMLAALECVDWVLPFSEETPQKMIATLLPDILVKGGDYTDITSIAGHQEVLENGGDVQVLNFVAGHSTTNIIKTIKGEPHD